MPVAFNYPGIYIEEVPSGVRTITGVATSIAAFVGRATRGPVNEIRSVTSYADYERQFGGLSLASKMSYAVRDFFLNGGSRAIIGRLFRPEGGGTSRAQFVFDNLTIEAASEGAWGNSLTITIDHNVSDEVASDQGLTKSDLFNITIKDTKTEVSEIHRNVSVIPGPRQLNHVLENHSELARVSVLPNSIPPPGEHLVTNKAAEEDLLQLSDYLDAGFADQKKGLYVLKQADLFNLLCLPPEWDTTDDPGYPDGLVAAAATLCEKERAMLILDSPSDWTDKQNAIDGMKNGIGTKSKNSAIFFPRIKQPNPLRENQLEEFVPCGTIAGIIARTDSERGVWKAPAGLDATLRGAQNLTVNLNDGDNGDLNPLGVNCLRTFPIIGNVIWGSRTVQGADILASQWKYIPVRRLALFIEESLYRGTQWVVFEPNDEPLRAQIRLNIGAFMQNLFVQRAFQGETREKAYFVKCDSETTTQNDINLGIVNIVVGFAPLKPAEFVIIKIQQMAGQIQT